MRTEHINGKKLLIYSSIDELPIINFQKYNKYLIFDSSIGSNVDDVQAHISRTLKLIDSNTEKAKKELTNMLQSLYMIANEISPKHMAFASLIHSIDGEKVTDYSDENLQLIIKSLNNCKNSFLDKLLSEIKKKISSELEVYFPQMFENAIEKEAYSRIKRKALLQLESIIDGVDNSDEIKAIDEQNMIAYMPKTFVGEKSAEIEYDKNFENTCLLISQKTSYDAHIMTTLQFYITINSVKAQIDAELKAYSKFNIKH